jgi:hypothetical protein
MKSFLTSSLAFIILFATACKKEKTVKAGKIGGEYTMYEYEDNSGTEAIPTKDGEHGKIVVTLKNDSIAKVQFALYDKSNKALIDETNDAKIEKSSDVIVLVLLSNNRVLAYIWEDYDMDFTGIPGTTFRAKKK